LIWPKPPSASSSIAGSVAPVHDFWVVTQRKPDNSFLWALGNLTLTTTTFVTLYTFRFSGIGIWLVEFVLSDFSEALFFQSGIFGGATPERGVS